MILHQIGVHCAINMETKEPDPPHDQWVATVCGAEDLATPDHSMVQMQRWDAAGFREQDASKKAKAAINYSF
jgi:hypothetical protein